MRVDAHAHGTNTDLPWLEAIAIVNNIRRPKIHTKEFPIDRYDDDLDKDVLPAVKKAIEDATASGGGQVVIPPGIWRCQGPIHLRTGVELHISEGAHLKFSPEPSLYLPNVLCRWEGVNLHNYSPMIYARDAADLAVTGRGVIDGGAEIWSSFRHQQRPDQEEVRATAENNVPIEKRQFGDGHFLRPSMLHLIRCERVLIEDVTLVNSPFWMIHPVYCEHVIIRNTRCDSMFINNDGVDVDSCSNVLIEGCVFRSGDDGIAMKAGRDKDAWDTGIPTRNVVIRDCDIPEALHGFAVGSEMSGGVENVYVHNVRIGDVKSKAIQFKSNRDRGGHIRNVHIQNVSARSAEGHFIFFTNDYHSYRGGHSPSDFSNITLKNLSCERAVTAIHLQGLPENPITDVSFSDVTVKTAEHVLSSHEHTTGITFENTVVNNAEITNDTPVDPSAEGTEK